MNPYIIRALMIAGCAATLTPIGICQQPAAKVIGDIQPAHPVTSRVPVDMLAQLSGSLQQLASKVSPAVVQIEVTGIGQTEAQGRSDMALIVRQHTIGAGIIVDPNGYIMTNAHVVSGAHRIRVILSAPPTELFDASAARKSQVLEAKIVGVNKEVDLALLKIEASNLPTLRLDVERSPQPGELVFAVGSPEGLQSSVSMGVISSAMRQPDPDNPMVYLQTDTAINPGNSGGPLVDVTGAVVGLNTLIMSHSGGSEGLGFAIPARIVNFVYQSFRKYGHVYRAEMGVVAQAITPTMAKGLGLAQDWGVVLADVTPQGPADAAGLVGEDVILAIDGHPVRGLSEFAAALYIHPPDQVLKINALRGVQELSVEVPAMRVRDPMDQLVDVADPIKSRVEQLGIFGLNFDGELHSVLPDMRIGIGVIVAGQAPAFNSVATGLRVGDVIHSVNRTYIGSLEQLKSAVAQLKPGDATVLGIERKGQFQYLAFEME
ncbi:MAG: serine protease Do [Acidobacteriaceae bacterium]|jgi:serine protease Do|nr:serine protease Do [Acidobacteriaceae bacterium]